MVEAILKLAEAINNLASAIRGMPLLQRVHYGAVGGGGGGAA